MFKQNEVLIAGHALWEFGAKMVAYPTFTTDVDNAVFQGLERSSVQLLHLRQAGKHMECEIDYFGNTATRTKHRSDLEALLITAKEPVIIDFGDGYFYRAVLEKISPGRCDNDVFEEVGYQFRATRHTDEIKINMSSGEIHVFCQSNVPLTDCRLAVPLSVIPQGTDELLIQLGGMTFFFRTEIVGDLILDGITKIFTMGGVNITNSAGFEWTDFPALTPGVNAVVVSTNGIILDNLIDPIGIRYLPTYQ